MKHLEEGERITVRDSEGVHGTASAEALKRADAQVFVTFGEGQHVQVPNEMLHRGEDGSAYLPLSLRELQAGTARLGQSTSSATDGTTDGTVIAVMPVVVEEASVTKREIETGRVRIRKSVQSVDELVDVPLLRDRVEVERVSVDRYLEEPAQPHYEGDTLVIPVMEEVLVIQKRLLLREEIRVTTLREQVRHQQAVTLQSEQVTVTREEPEHQSAALRE